MKTYEIEYDSFPLATVEIDEEISTQYIKEMVEFWWGWRDKLSKNNGDYIKVFLGDLAMFILRSDSVPRKGVDEGWYPLDGSHGIRIVDWSIFEHDESEIHIYQT